MSKKYKVCVMLSTYNGEKYIREQLDSILKQKSIDLIVYIRDDGSTDSTYNILKSYKESNDNIILCKGNNIGWRKSFMNILKSAPIADFYAFSDQDDVWKDNKLETAVNKLINYKKEVALYGSNVTVTNEQLVPLKLYNNEKLNVINRPFEQLLDVSMMPGGLTYVFTPKLKEMMKRWTSAGDYGHDFICYLLATLFGYVIYDNNSYVLYRQHKNNEIGAPGGKLWRLRTNLKNFFGRSIPHKSLWAEKVLHLYPEIEQDSRKKMYLQLLKEYPNSYKNKMILLKNPNLYRNTRYDTLCLHIKIITNKW